MPKKAYYTEDVHFMVSLEQKKFLLNTYGSQGIATYFRSYIDASMQNAHAGLDELKNDLAKLEPEYLELKSSQADALTRLACITKIKKMLLDGARRNGWDIDEIPLELIGFAADVCRTTPDKIKSVLRENNP